MSELQNPSVALVGSPNSGKTTLYNWLTNSKFKTVNYPGATIEYFIGPLASHLKKEGTQDWLVMDTPGTYSLHPKSADEAVTLKSLYENPSIGGRVDAVIVVVDGTQLQRHLLLAEHIRETGFPMILAVTMSDLLEKQGLKLNLQELRAYFNCEVLVVNGLLGGGLQEIVSALGTVKLKSETRLPQEWSETKLQEKSRNIAKLISKVVSNPAEIKNDLLASTLRLDRLLLHPIFGIFLFVGIMFLFFSSIYFLAAPFMDLIDSSFSNLGQKIIALAPESLLSDFVANAVIRGMSAILVFTPQIFILFFGISFLESSGYLARAATLIDKPFSWLGLSGRSFVPILSGFACAVPAIMATRNLSSKRDRMISQFVIPLMTCSARLPVYALLLGFLFVEQAPWKAGLALALLYFTSLVVGGIAAGIINRLVKGEAKSFLMMELPLYRRPRFSVILYQSLHRTKAFIQRAGPVIFTFSIFMWALVTFPNFNEKNAELRTQTSYAAKTGQFIEPIFRPMGVDWRVGFGLISAFTAREVFVSSLAVMFNAKDDSEETQASNLLKAMGNAVNSEGQRIFTVASVLGLIVFFMIALQCMSTFAITRKESGSTRFALVQLIAFNIIAYILSVSLVQTLHWIGVA